MKLSQYMEEAAKVDNLKIRVLCLQDHSNVGPTTKRVLLQIAMIAASKTGYKLQIGGRELTENLIDELEPAE